MRELNISMLTAIMFEKKVQSQIMVTHYTRSQDQLTDILTKPLSSTKFHQLLSKLGSFNFLDPAREGVLAGAKFLAEANLQLQIT